MVRTCPRQHTLALIALAKSPENPHPENPPSHLHARFIRLSTLVSDSLNRISPHVSPYLSPEFSTLPPGRTVAMTAAEKEMEVIRKRRDVLIAKAAQMAHSDRAASYAQQYAGGQVPYPPWSPPNKAETPRMPHHAHPNGYTMMSPRTMETTAMEPPAHWGGTCHSCGIGLAGEGQNGPDGPMSLCNICGVSPRGCVRRRELMDSRTMPDYRCGARKAQRAGLLAGRQRPLLPRRGVAGAGLGGRQCC